MGLIGKALWGEGGFEARIPEIEETLGQDIREAWNANHLAHGRQVGGKLLLTDTRLVFYPSNLERGAALGVIRTLATVSPDGISGRVFRREGSVWAADLAAIEAVDSTWMIRSYLRIKLDDGSKDEFAVSKIKQEVIPRIRAAMA